MGLTVHGGASAYIEVIGKPLKGDQTFRIDASEVVRSAPGKDGAPAEVRIPVSEVTKIAYFGSASGGDQRRYDFVVGSADASIKLEWTSYSWFMMKTRNQKDGAQLWSELTSFAGRELNPLIAGRYWQLLKAGQAVQVAGFTLSPDGITGGGRKGEAGTFTPWTQVRRAIITGDQVHVVSGDGKKVLYRAHRQTINAVVMPNLVGALVQAASG